MNSKQGFFAVLFGFFLLVDQAHALTHPTCELFMSVDFKDNIHDFKHKGFKPIRVSSQQLSQQPVGHLVATRGFTEGLGLVSFNLERVISEKPFTTEVLYTKMKYFALGHAIYAGWLLDGLLDDLPTCIINNE